jgi:hypothetical protein
MGFRMKTTLVIDDGIFRRVKHEAVARRQTRSQIVETALRQFLDRKGASAPAPALPRFDLGAPLVDIADREALYQAMEGR